MTIFDFIRSKVDILEVVSVYLELKRAGGYLKGSCPFHFEKDASFTISPMRQMYYCFGCKKGGDLVAFVAEIEQITQFEAAVFLGDKYKIEIPQSILVLANKEAPGALNRNKYMTSHEVIAKWCHEELKQSPRALAYLSSRSISKDSIVLFEIGYFPGSKEKKKQLLKKLLQESILQKDLDEIGFFNSFQNNEISSSFEERIIFPIKDGLNRYVGFGGRVFLPNDDRAKYYNSKETEFFLKKKMLYSYFLAKTKASKDKSFILVEGYLDAILMHQHGYQNTVATLGTACSKEQLLMMSRSADKLVVMYDSDSAGIGAVLKMVELSFDSALNIFVVVLDAGVDPADQLQSNPEKMKELASSSLGLLEFFISRLSEDFFALSNVKKLERLQKILLVAEKIVDPIKRYLILQKISHLTGVKYSMLESKVGVGAISVGSVSASSRINFAEKYSQEEIVFFLELIERSKRNRSAFVMPEFYIIFSEKISSFFIILDKILQQDILIDLISSFEKEIPEYERPWLLDGIMYFETAFEAKKINYLLEKLFLQYTKDVLRNCSRTSNLGIDLEERVKINQILTSIKSISILMKERENV